MSKCIIKHNQLHCQPQKKNATCNMQNNLWHSEVICMLLNWTVHIGILNHTYIKLSVPQVLLIAKLSPCQSPSLRLRWHPPFWTNLNLASDNIIAKSKVALWAYKYFWFNPKPYNSRFRPTPGLNPARLSLVLLRPNLSDTASRYG